MENMGLGAGLAAMGFWGFIAIVVVAGIWYSIKEKEAQQETVRRLIESGQNIDPETLDRLLSASDKSNENTDRDLKVAGWITLSAAAGLGVLGFFLGQVNDKALMTLLGVAGLVACVGLGLLVAGKFAERWNREGRASSLNDV